MDEPLKALEELGDQFERTAYAARRPRRRTRRHRVLALAVLGALLVAATAMAASGLLTGEPVRNPPGVTFKADEGLGKPLPDQTNLLDLRVPDPAGGPPWGMRTVRTTRGLACVEVGRVVDGKLGVLGQNGAFGDDGRFHELPADVLTQAYCEQPDGAGNLFIAISYQGMPASALPQGCRPSAQPEPLEIAGRPQAPALPTCQPADERILYFGLLGPQARSITYDNEREQATTTPVSGPHGAYLVVLRPTEQHPALGRFVPSTSPGSGLESVQYEGAPTCTIRSPRSIGGAKRCPLVGYVEPATQRVTAEQVEAPVRATFAPRPTRPDRPGAPPTANVPPQWELTITFRARLAADAQSTYTIETTGPKGGSGCTGTSFSPITRDIAAGETVRQTVYIPANCQGSVRGRVTFPQSLGPSPGLPDTLGKGKTVGDFQVEVPTP
jgi:hypothetical protein